MSKNTDFFKLGPYSRKNNIRTGTETKIEQTENNWAKLVVPRALGVHGHARGKAPVAGCTRACHTCPLPRSRGSAGPVGSRLRLARLACDTCRRLAGAALLHPMVNACPAPVAALRRSPSAPFFFSFFFLLCPLKTETQTSFPIFISFDP